MQATIFERCGGFSTVSRLVEDFYDNALDSDIIGPYFDNVDMQSLINHQTQFMTYVLGGPSHFSDDSLYAAHKGLKIDENAWQEALKIIRQSLHNSGFTTDEIDIVMQTLALKKDLILES